MLLCGYMSGRTVNTRHVNVWSSEGPFMFLLHRRSMWPQPTSFIVTEGNTEALITPASPQPLPFSIQNDSHNPSVKVQAAWLYVSAPAHTPDTRRYRTCTRAEREREREIKSWDAPESLQSKPMAQRLATRYFFYHSVLFTSKGFNRMTSGVEAVPTRLTINSFSQRISFSLIPLFLYFTLQYRLHSETMTDAQKKGGGGASLPLRFIAAELLIRWTGLWFILYLLAVIYMHILLSPSPEGLSGPLTDGLTDQGFFLWKNLLRSAWTIKRLNRKHSTAGYEYIKCQEHGGRTKPEWVKGKVGVGDGNREPWDLTGAYFKTP